MSSSFFHLTKGAIRCLQTLHIQKHYCKLFYFLRHAHDMKLMHFEDCALSPNVLLVPIALWLPRLNFNFMLFHVYNGHHNKMLGGGGVHV